MKKPAQKTSAFLAAWIAGDYPTIVLPSAWLLLVGGLFGIRNIILSPILVSLLNNRQIADWLQPVYWLCILVSGATLFLHYRKHPVRFFPLVKAGEVLGWIVLAAPFLYFACTRRIGLDFWLDEMMSIVRHIQPSISSALTWYPVPNNHVFTNFLGGLYIQLIGRQEMQAILTQPVILRLFYFAPSLAAILTLAYTARRFIGKWAGWLTVILIGTTIPFLNFSAQVRGYSYTIFFASLQIHFLLAFREKPERKLAIGIGLLTCFLFYTIASNLYYILALIAFYLLAGEAYRPRTWLKKPARRFKLSRDEFSIVNTEITIAAALTAGILLALLFYLPIFDSVFANRYVESFGLLRGTVLFDAFPRTMFYFFSNRAWLFGFAWLGGAGAWWSARKNGAPARGDLLVLLISASFLPYLISFIRGDAPFERTFLVTLPAFTLLAAFGLSWYCDLADDWRRAGGRLPLAIVGIAAYGTFAGTYLGIEAEIATNLQGENIKQVEIYDNTLWASHFLDQYHVLPVIRPAVEKSDEMPILIDGGNTRFAFVIVEYLRGFGVPVVEFEHPDEIDAGSAYLILSYPDRSLQAIRAVYPEARCTPESEVLSIYRSYHCVFAGPPPG